MSKLKDKKAKILSPFDTSSHKTERTNNQKLVEWMNLIINENGLALGKAEQETAGADRKQPDIVLYKAPQSNDVLCVIELKQPYFDPFNNEALKEPARQKASVRKAPYFATSNFKKLILFKTEEVNRMADEPKQISNIYDLSAIEDPDSIDEPRFKNSIINGLKKLLFDLVDFSTGKKAEPLLPIDELLIVKLHLKNDRLAHFYKDIIRDKFHKDTAFAKKMTDWFIEQQWNFAAQDTDFDKAARQTAYLLINKILFYQTLKAKQHGLASLVIPDDLTAGGQLKKYLQSNFSYITENIDYETIYSTDFIDEVAFPDNKNVVEEIKNLINLINEYDFSTLGYDVIGKIFERLIPANERHNLGQYFTSADVVDLILKFCMASDTDKLLDPSCGTGTFLVRAYQHKKLSNYRLTHQDILEDLWGVDIAKFPAHLSTINLAINDLGVVKNYPNIAQEDFFHLTAHKDGLELPDNWRKIRAQTLGVEQREITYPKWFDCIVGNPPYTRQEEITEITEQTSYKEVLIKNALYLGSTKLADIPKRAGIHAYFFVHGTKFLKENGHFGFIVSNSWLDVDYGRGLQEFFLNNYKIVTIVESKVERWFEAADINTCIIILQKCKNKTERNHNLVRFVYLKKPLRNFIPPAQNIWEKQIGRLNEIDKLKKTILAHTDFYENEELRIYPKNQKELWDEGFDTAENKYTGAKWGKYLRAPEIFFKLLAKSKDKLVPLKEIADVRFGIKTGANEFFYLTEDEIKRRGIEKEFWMHKDDKNKWIPNWVIVKANEIDKPIINSALLKYRILFINKNIDNMKGTRTLDYIKLGEKKGYNKRPTCFLREPKRNWFNLGDDINDIIAFPERVRLRHIVMYNPEMVSLNKNLYGIKPYKNNISKLLAIALNSTFTAFYTELFARQPGGGGGPLDIDVYVAADILLPQMVLIEQYKKKIINSSILTREIESIFSELGASSLKEVSLEKVKPDRRELDKIIMGDILGLTDEEQLEVYKAVVDLVKSRIEKAKSVDGHKTTKDGVDMDAMKKSVIERVNREEEK